VSDFRDDARLDPSQVDDRRGRRRRGPVVAGGGIASLVVVLVVVLLGGDPFGGSGGLGSLEGLDGGTIGAGAPPIDVAAECTTGADAERRDDCRAIGYVNSIQAYWRGALDGYRPTRTVFFDGGVDTACGAAPSAVGPFYCPRDQQVYIDLGFMAVLRDEFGATAGPFAQAYVLAHEYGHHVQNLGGGLRGSGVGSELQADCFAGVWAANAVATGVLASVSEAEIADALDAAAAVGDDRIQERTQGQVDPETWTHGSSEQRQQAFTTGLAAGDPTAC
jgi:uncharacterized protein